MTNVISTGIPIIVDIENGGLVNVVALENRLHRGEVFATGGVSGAIAKDDSYVAYLRTPADCHCHMRMKVIGTDAYSYVIHEGVAVSSPGSAVHIVNLNRNSAVTSHCLSYHTPSISGAGTVLNGAYIGSADIGGGGEVNLVEVILKEDTGYSLTLTAKKSATYFTYQIVWWEHEV